MTAITVNTIAIVPQKSFTLSSFLGRIRVSGLFDDERLDDDVTGDHVGIFGLTAPPAFSISP